MFIVLKSNYKNAFYFTMVKGFTQRDKTYRYFQSKERQTAPIYVIRDRGHMLQVIKMSFI